MNTVQQIKAKLDEWGIPKYIYLPTISSISLTTLKYCEKRRICSLCLSLQRWFHTNRQFQKNDGVKLYLLLKFKKKRNCLKKNAVNTQFTEKVICNPVKWEVKHKWISKLLYTALFSWWFYTSYPRDTSSERCSL